ncbi:MAG TPA: phage holin family protein [Pyrinomonadaceae bacterium]|nr:phage holin family protein [Pyrinomonadaceae bacterium]
MATPATALDRRSEQRTEIENLPVLLSRLGDDVTRLFDTKMSLLRIEVKEDVTSFLRAGIGIAVASIVALLGFALASVAGAFGIATLLADTDLSQAARYGLGFLSVGLIYSILGSIVAVVMKGRLSKQSLVPDRTIREIRKDKEWLKNEL